MNSFRRLLAVLGTTATAVSLAVLMPAYAWAADHPTLVSAGSEVARRRRSYRGGGIGCGAVCCLLFVAIIVVIVLLIVRRRRRPGQP
jgi:hypothetical protein